MNGSAQENNKHSTICPYLGLMVDSKASYSFPNKLNACYRVRSPQPLILTQQRKVCLTPGHTQCEGYRYCWKDGFPKELRNHNWRRPKNFVNRLLNIPRAALIALIALCLLGGTLGIFAFKQLWTATVAAPTPTPGPALLTPFGAAERTFVIYQIQEGESLPEIAVRYDTTAEVLQALNNPLAPAFWAGQNLVVCVGCQDASGLHALQAVYLEENLALADLAQDYGTTQENLKRWNSLGESDWVPGGRWIVVPAN